MISIAPTLACADPLHLAKAIDALAWGEADAWHVDIMDGHYVPNLCFSFEQAAAIGAYSDIPLDVHLMMQKPEAWLERLTHLAPQRVAFHLDTSASPESLIEKLREAHIQPGLALNPQQPVERLEPMLPLVDYVLLMGIRPGFSGQTFLPGTYDKLKGLNQLRREKQLHYTITVDGGISPENGRLCAELGADGLVTGAHIWVNRPEGIAQACINFKKAVEMQG